MPIGAAIGGAVIAGGGAVAAGAISSHAQTKAANTAADTSLQVANENNQLIRDTRDQNVGIAAPFYNNGLAASNALNGLLGLPASTGGTGALSGITGQTSDSGNLGGYSSGALDSYLAANPDVAKAYTNDPGISHSEFPTADSYAAWHYQHYGQNEGRAAPTAVTTPAAGTGSATGALSPFDTFRNSTNYQWRYDQGLNAQNSALAAKGALDSGAATKAAINYGQNTASNELANYMNLLAGQQQVGLSAGNAVMGVSTNATNNITAQNTNAGNVAANAALTAGQANANMWGTIGSTAGQLGGALFQYGVGGGAPKVPTAQSINVTPNWGAGYGAGYGGVP